MRVWIALSVRQDASEAVYDVGIAVDTGEVVTLIGPRGSGQSNVLRVLAGCDSD